MIELNLFVFVVDELAVSGFEIEFAEVYSEASHIYHNLLQSLLHVATGLRHLLD